MGHFCPPGSRSGFGFRIRIRIHWPDWILIQSGSAGSGSTDLMESGSNPDPDPKPCFFCWSDLGLILASRLGSLKWMLPRLCGSTPGTPAMSILTGSFLFFSVYLIVTCEHPKISLLPAPLYFWGSGFIMLRIRVQHFPIRPGLSWSGLSGFWGSECSILQTHTLCEIDIFFYFCIICQLLQF
jgi:hypothetical protein